MEFEQRLQRKLLSNIPRLLSLLDKNPFSCSYGSFDRKFWQYKIIDFSSGMQQELVFPLAYVYSNPFDNNSYYKSKRVAELLDGIFLFHKICCHSDGSMDDYFPFERAFGATAYALAAATEAAIIKPDFSKKVMPAFKKSGEFLAKYQEKGFLSNHYAIAATALINLFYLTGEIEWKEFAERIVAKLLESQNSEGWFTEYNGCDPGYLTVTIEFLARYYQKNEDKNLLEALSKSCQFLKTFVHPDGSLGGEYGSRNTYNFYPGGFAILSGKIPEAVDILSGFAYGLDSGACNYLEDDGAFGHMLSSYVTVLQQGDLPSNVFPYPFRKNNRATISYPESGLYRIGKKDFTIVGCTGKGGSYKVFKHNELLYSDTGLIGRLKDGTIFCQNNTNSSSGVVDGERIHVKGKFYKYTNSRLKKIEMIGLRVLSIIFGYLPGYSNWIRGIMQRVLIYKKKYVGINFERKIDFSGHHPVVTDILYNKKNIEVIELYRSTDCVNMHVVTSSSFQLVNLLTWEQLNISTSSKVNEYVKKY